MVAHDISASIVSNESSLHLEATATAGDEHPGAIKVVVDSDFGVSTTTTVEAEGVDASLPAECYVSIFSVDAARELRDTRLAMRPEGLLDLEVSSGERGRRRARDDGDDSCAERRRVRPLRRAHRAFERRGGDDPRGLFESMDGFPVDARLDRV